MDYNMTSSYDAETAQADTTESSTVSKHVLLWTLLTIVANTMAQSAAIDNNNTLYYHSSPLYSLAYILWIWIHAIAKFASLKNKEISVGQVLRHAKQSTNIFSQDEAARSDIGIVPVNSKTWPRWLFFMLGSLPATIKLCSFEGVPWAQAFGLMSFTAFVLNEVFIVLVKGDSVDDNNLGTIIDQESLIEESNTKDSVKAKGILIVLTAVSYFVLGILNAAFIAWAAFKVWIVLIEAFQNNDNDITRLFEWTFLIIGLTVDTIFILYFIIICGINLRYKFATNKDRSPSYYRFARWFPYSMITFFLATLLPSKNNRERRSSTMNFFWDFDAVAFFGFCFFWVARVIMRVVVRKCHRIGDALFLLKETNEIKEDGEAVQGKELDSDKWYSFSFFWIHLWLAVAWYQFVYDGSDTRNPEWTEVFGR